MLMMKKKKTSLWTISPCSSCSLNQLHEDLIIDEILLKLPVKSLLRLRCVSRYFHSLITNPSFIKKHLHHTSAQLNHNLLLISCRLSDDRFRHYDCNVKSSIGSNDDDDLSTTPPQVVLEEMHCPFESTGIMASCNGLLFLHKYLPILDTKMKTGYIWNPCTKEYKQVKPPLRIKEHLFEGIQKRRGYYYSGFCGFGYDCIHDEYKILYCEHRVGNLPGVVFDNHHLSSIMEFKVYKLGTNTWTSISGDHNPYRSFFFGNLWSRIGQFTNGALHWIVSSSSRRSSVMTCSRNSKIISFCMEKEEFREIRKPYHSEVENPYYYTEEEEVYNEKFQKYYRYGELQVLQGCLCICESPPGFGTIHIWMLKDYANDSSWTKLYTVKISRDWEWYPDAYYGITWLKLLRLGQNGEIVMTIHGHKDIIVYDSVNHLYTSVGNLNLHNPIREGWEYQVIHVDSLVSLNSGIYKS